MAVCSQIHTKHINTLCGQNVELLNVKPGCTFSNHWALVGSHLWPLQQFALSLHKRSRCALHSFSNVNNLPTSETSRDILAIRTYSRNLRTLRHRDMSGISAPASDGFRCSPSIARRHCRHHHCCLLDGDVRACCALCCSVRVRCVSVCA